MKHTLLVHALLIVTAGSSAGSVLAQPAAQESRARGAESLDAARRVFVSGGDGVEAIHPLQRWRVLVDERGFAVAPQHTDWTWGFELQAYGWGEHIDGVGPPQALSTAGSRCERDWDGRITEWYVNGELGLEHGFTLAARPEGANGELRLELAVRGGLAPVVADDGDGIVFCDDAGIAQLDYTGLVVFDADGDRCDAHFVAVDGGVALLVDESAADYPLTIDPLAQRAFIKASNTDAFDFFGWSIDVDGDTLVVGAWGEASAATGVGGAQNDNSAQLAGAAYVFVRSGTTWVQQAYLKASNTDVLDKFGTAVAICGDTLVVGAIGEDSPATVVDGSQGNFTFPLDGAYGAAYVFERVGGAWTQTAYLKASNSGNGDTFGSSLDIDGNRIVVGAPYEDGGASGVGANELDNSAPNAGAVYVFERSGSSWAQTTYIKASNAGLGDSFGISLALDGDTLVVGAPLEDAETNGVNGNQSSNEAPNAGAAYAFVYDGATWIQQAYVKAANSGAGDMFGGSVALDGNTFVVGAISEDSAATGVNGATGDFGGSNTFDAGAAYVFVRSGTTWSQQAYIKPSNTGGLDEFGSAVAIEGDIVVVGAPREDSNASGVGGNQFNDFLPDSGATYVFERTGTSWLQTAYVKATPSNTDDGFGSSVAIEDQSIVVGAIGESSNAVGIGGVSTGVATASGAVYAFDPTNWDRIEGCLSNQGGFVEPNVPPSIGTQVDVALLGGSVPDGLALVYFGTKSLDAFGCGTLVAPTVELLMAATPLPTHLVTVLVSNGNASVPVSIPNKPELVGLEVTLQALLVDVSTGHLEGSNGLEMRIQN